MGLALLAFGDHFVVLQAGDVHGQHFLEARSQTHHLEATGIGEGGPGPVHECPDAAGLVDDIAAGLQIEVEGIGQHGLAAQLGDLFGQHGLHVGFGADHDERRGFDLAMGSPDDAGASQAVGQSGIYPETEVVGTWWLTCHRSELSFPGTRLRLLRG
ncbi:hypothetical protein SDC9_109403 [bioreactor metagenome]|uniref:Uncharacterized protein n=1 Tax=bioreactor metagenome TaxID=1076179 RepID=A0A645BAM7_9ZZZZ